MKVEDLRKLLEASEDRLAIFADKAQLNQCEGLNVSKLIGLINDFLTDEQKEAMLEFEHFKKSSPYLRKSIMEAISADDIKLRLLQNDELLENVDKYKILDVVKSLKDHSKILILRDSNFREKHELKSPDIRVIVLLLGDKAKEALLEDKDFAQNQLGLENYMITEVVSTLQNEEAKLQMIDIYNFEKYLVGDILKTFSDESKKGILVEDRYHFGPHNIVSIISSMDNGSLIRFLKENKTFLMQHDIRPWHIIKELDSERQLEFISKFEDADLTVRRKKTDFSCFETRNKRGDRYIKIPRRIQNCY